MYVRTCPRHRRASSCRLSFDKTTAEWRWHLVTCPQSYCPHSERRGQEARDRGQRIESRGQETGDRGRRKQGGRLTIDGVGQRPSNEGAFCLNCAKTTTPEETRAINTIDAAPIACCADRTERVCLGDTGLPRPLPLALRRARSRGKRPESSLKTPDDRGGGQGHHFVYCLSRLCRELTA